MFRTMIMTDGSQQTVRVRASGPGWLRTTRGEVYWQDARHQRWCLASCLRGAAMPIDNAQFYAQLVATAWGNLPCSTDARQAARDALTEAHSALSQRAFFAALDALGGQEALLDRVEQALRTTAADAEDAAREDAR